jgi:hypothetical protein
MNINVSQSSVASTTPVTGQPPRTSRKKSVTARYAEFERALAASVALGNCNSEDEWQKYCRAVSKCTTIVERLVAEPSRSVAEMLLKIRASTFTCNDNRELGEGLEDLQDANNLLVGLNADLKRLRDARFE